MNFSEYVRWCNERTRDGCWDILTAMTCFNIIKTVKKVPFWKREKYWKDVYENRVLEEIIFQSKTPSQKEKDVETIRK